MRTGTPIGKNNVALCIERIFAEEPRQVDHKYAILRNQQQYLVNTLVKIVICSIVPNIMFWVFFHKTEEFMFLKDKFIELFRRMGKRKKSS